MKRDIAAFTCGLMIAGFLIIPVGILWHSILIYDFQTKLIQKVTVNGEPIDIVQLENGTFIKCDGCKKVIGIESR